MAKSQKIVLTTFGSHGDLHPYMAIALELQARGQYPIIATSALYEEKIRGAGIDFAPLRPDIDPPSNQDQEMIEKIMDPRRGPRFLIEEIIFASLRDSYADLTVIARDADLLITHPATPAGPLVARKLQLPWISTVLAPISFLSAYDPPMPPYWAWTNKLKILGPRVMGFAFNLIKKTFSVDVFDRLREELGLSDTGHPMFDGQHSPTLVLALFSDLFASAKPDWPPQTRSTGFAFYDGRHETEMSPELVRFLAEGTPPIIFTLGTSAVWVARDFFQESIAAAKILGRRAVLLIGDERNRISDLSPDLIAVEYAPFESLLERGCAMVHHGGIGTTSQGLRAGIPTLIVPFAFDQPDNAAHAARLGTSRTLGRQRYQQQRVARELDKLLNNAQYASKAKAVGEQLHREQGAKRACDLIETVLKQTPNGKQELDELIYAAGN